MRKKFELKVLTFVAWVLMQVLRHLCWAMVRRMPLDIGPDGKERSTGSRLGGLNVG